jgi:ectoine hydroxylase-related dioxygenase (phytanoyl-CoA dioxygenase family)
VGTKYSEGVPADPGYSIHESVFSIAECHHLIAALSADSFPRTRAGARHLMSHPAVRAIASDPRLTRIARATPFRATLFDKTPATNWLIPWHQDTALPLTARFDLAGWGPWSRKGGFDYSHAPAWALARVIALRLHLDDSRANNGPLRVIPGSHTSGVLTDEEIAARVGSTEPVECLITAGGVIAMRPLLIHASSKVLTHAPRRVLHIEYAEALELADGIRLAIT